MTYILIALFIFVSGDFHVKGNPWRDGCYDSTLSPPLYLEARENIFSSSIEFYLRKPQVHYASPFYSNEKLYFISKNGDIYEYYNDNLKLIVKLRDEVVATPETFNGIAFIITTSGTLIGFDLNSKTIIFKINLLSPPGFVSPLLTNQGIFLTSSDGEILRANLSGKIEKIFKTGADEKIFYNKTIAFNSSKNVLFWVDGKGIIHAFNTELEELWQKESDERVFRISLIPEQDMLLAGSNYRIVFYNIKTGDKVRETLISDEVYDFAIYQRNIYITTGNGKVVLVNTDTGKFFKEVKYGDKNESGFISISSNGTIVIGSSKGRLVVMNSVLKVLETVRLEGGVHAEPVIWNGHVAVITDRGNAYILGQR